MSTIMKLALAAVFAGSMSTAAFAQTTGGSGARSDGGTTVRMGGGISVGSNVGAGANVGVGASGSGVNTNAGVSGNGSLGVNRPGTSSGRSGSHGSPGGRHR